MLDRWSSYTVAIVWEFAWADSVLVVLDEWSSNRGGHLNRLDCISKCQNIILVVFNEISPSKNLFTRFLADK